MSRLSLTALAALPPTVAKPTWDPSQVGVGIVVALAAFSYLGPLFYHTNQVTVNLNNATLPPGLATRSAPTATALTFSAG